MAQLARFDGLEFDSGTKNGGRDSFGGLAESEHWTLDRRRQGERQEGWNSIFEARLRAAIRRRRSGGMR